MPSRIVSRLALFDISVPDCRDSVSLGFSDISVVQTLGRPQGEQLALILRCGMSPYK